jgi:penicillin-binding protein 2
VKPPFKKSANYSDSSNGKKRNAKATDPQKTQMQREDDSDGYKDWRAYEDQLMKGYSLPNRSQRIRSFFKSRYAFIGLIFILCFLLLTGSVVHIQLFTSDDTKDLLERGISRQMTIPAARGEIYDAYGNRLAWNEPVNNIYIAYANLENERFNQVLRDVSILLDRYDITYDDVVSDYIDLDEMKFTMSDEDIINWQKNTNFLGLRDLPEGQVESALDTQFVKPTPEVFYEFMRQVKFGISDNYSEDEQKSIFALRFKIYLSNWFFQQGQPIEIGADVPEELTHIVNEQNYRYIGVISGETFQRHYAPEARYMAQVVGYIGDINNEEHDELAEQGYGYHDTIGKSGMELAAERYLHGTNGVKRYHVWADEEEQADPLIDSGGKDPIAGYDVHLTIRPDVQKVALDELYKYIQYINSREDDPLSGKSTGCAVMLDLKNNGAVVAMANYPYFNPQDFMDMEDDEEAAKRVEENLLDVELKPMYNRAIAWRYPPGSTFKAFTGLAALEAGAISESTTFNCEKYIYVDGHRFRCDGTHHEIRINKALAYSCNIYFYNAGMAAGIDNLSETYRILKLGELTGIELHGEDAGVRPSREEKASLFEDPGDQVWFRADTAQVSIGQGLNAYTALQLARATGALATGRMNYPHIIEKVVDENGEVIYRPSDQSDELPFSEHNMQVVRNGMREVVTDPNSTAYSSFFNMPVSVAGKTGTAEVTIETGEISTDGLFICFAPFYDPEVAICVAANAGARGAGISEVAASMIRAYYNSSHE